jgi:hypothetical protein
MDPRFLILRVLFFTTAIGPHYQQFDLRFEVCDPMANLALCPHFGAFHEPILPSLASRVTLAHAPRITLEFAF